MVCLCGEGWHARITFSDTHPEGPPPQRTPKGAVTGAARAAAVTGLEPLPPPPPPGAAVCVRVQLETDEYEDMWCLAKEWQEECEGRERQVHREVCVAGLSAGRTAARAPRSHGGPGGRGLVAWVWASDLPPLRCCLSDSLTVSDCLTRRSGA